MDIFIRGLVIGFSIAAPVGPIGVLCIRRTLAEGRISGLVSGIGAASADAIYGFIAGFGITFISNFLVAQQTLLGLAGGLFLCYLGIRTFLAQPGQQEERLVQNGLAANYFSTFVLTLANPVTILSFAAIFAGLGLAGNGGDYLAATWMVLGVFSGSALWWLTLSQGVGTLKKRLSTPGLMWINRISGLIIFGFGLFSWIRAFTHISPL
jgi:threonine/homoserine/homoserine lactone efflux protein